MESISGLVAELLTVVVIRLNLVYRLVILGALFNSISFSLLLFQVIFLRLLSAFSLLNLLIGHLFISEGVLLELGSASIRVVSVPSHSEVVRHLLAHEVVPEPKLADV